MPGSQPDRPRRAPVAPALLVAVLLAGLLPMPVAIAVEAPLARPPIPQADAAPPEQQPSIAYLEATAHEDDAIEFQPGGLVEVGFTPRAGDRWPIDGHAPGALPPGRATGQQMAASPNGSRWTDTKPHGPKDGPGAQGAATPAPSSAPSSSAAPDPSRRPPRSSPPPRPGLPDSRLRASPTPSPAPAVSDAPAVPAASGDPADAPPSPAATPAPVDAPGGRPRHSGPGRLARAPRRARRRPRRRVGPAPAGVRVPPVLGALGRIDQAQLRRPVDHRVLLGGGHVEGQSQEEGRGRHEHHRVGRLDQLVDDAGHQRGPPARHARRPHGLRVRLDVEPGQRPEGDPRQRDRAPEPRTPDGSGRSRPGRRRRQPRLRAPRLRLRRRVRGVPQDHAQRAQQDQERATSSPTTRPASSATTRSRRPSGAGAADAIFVMGYDYRTAGSSERRVHRPAVRSQVRPHRHGPRLHGAGQAIPRDPRACPGTGAPGPPRPTTVRATTQSGAKYGYSTAVNYESVTDLVREHGRRWDPVEQSPYVAYRRQNCTQHVRLRDQLAPGLLRRRRLAQAAAGDGQRVRPAGAPACGPWATTAATRSSTGRSPSPSWWTSPHPRPASSCSRPPRPTRASWSSGQPRT